MNDTLFIITWSSVLVTIFLVLSLVIKQKTEKAKLFLFWGMSVVIIFATMFIVIETVIKNTTSVTKGPVHWHADFQIWACGNQIDLIDPTGLANRVGTPVFHEHNDNRIHVEGTVQQLSDVNLQQFFAVIDGELTTSSIKMLTNDGLAEFADGDLCPDGTEGTLQVFLYETKGDLVFRSKLDDFTKYVPAPESVIPPGDCIIIEFGEQKEMTDRICNFYAIDLENGDLRFNSPSP